jgi:mono/diheme cytochrome c family protein
MRFRIFVVSSCILFISALLAIWVDFDREWKHYQREFKKLEIEKTLSEIDDLKKSFDSDSEYKNLEKELREEEEKINSKETLAKQEDLEKQISKTQFELYIAEREAKFTKSNIDAIDYQIAKKVNLGSDVSSLQSKKAELSAKWEEQKKYAQQVKTKYDNLVNQKNNIFARYKELKSKYEDKIAKLDMLTKKLDAIHKRPIKVDQILVPELNNTIDRCITCHQAINKEGFESKKYPKVFQTHPNKELYLVKHKLEEFGCVSCHQGQGIATRTDAAHGQVAFWDKPMFEGKQAEASCVKCHKTTDNIGADFFEKGKELVNASNCFACHKIDGMPAPMKNGPPLLQASSKLNQGWLVKWVENPRHYLPKSKMPTFPLTSDDAKAVSTYILSSSDSNYGEKKNIIPRPELASEGEKVYQAKGCASCHAIKGVGANVGPDLGRIASKTNPTWLFNWIKNPRTYHPTTVMPNLGLTDQETLAVVSYLQKFKWDNVNLNQTLDLKDTKTIEKGKELIKAYGCASCHNIAGIEGQQNCPNLTNEMEKDIHKFDFGYSHLDPERGVFHLRESYVFNKIKNPAIYNDFVKGKMPNFWFTDEQANAVYTYIVGMTTKSDEIPAKYIYKEKSTEESNKEIK